MQFSDVTYMTCKYFYMNVFYACVLSHFKHVRLFATLWTISCQALLSMGFSRQGYWSELPFASPGDLPHPGIKPRSSTLQADSLPSEPSGPFKIFKTLGSCFPANVLQKGCSPRKKRSCRMVSKCCSKISMCHQWLLSTSRNGKVQKSMTLPESTQLSKLACWENSCAFKPLYIYGPGLYMGQKCTELHHFTMLQGKC